MQDEQITYEEENAEEIPPGVRWGWILWCCAALGWYYYGYIRSLDSVIAPIYGAVPVLGELIGKGMP